MTSRLNYLYILGLVFVILGFQAETHARPQLRDLFYQSDNPNEPQSCLLGLLNYSLQRAVIFARAEGMTIDSYVVNSERNLDYYTAGGLLVINRYYHLGFDVTGGPSSFSGRALVKATNVGPQNSGLGGIQCKVVIRDRPVPECGSAPELHPGFVIINNDLELPVFEGFRPIIDIEPGPCPF